MTCKPFDVVVIPFPFTDSGKTKRRPALVLSGHGIFGKQSGHTVMAMITSAKNTSWSLDVQIDDLSSAGLTAPSTIRMKLFTLDNRFIIRNAGKLAKPDIKKFKDAFSKLLKW
ncbi:MAG: type II toxin-antitoxin system PemK/MazF family toxin [Kiritimatiellia bacterium]